jgi:hypothetical protein
VATSTERIEFELLARDRNARRTFNDVARAADDAGDSIIDLGKDSKHLERDIDSTKAHLKDLIAEFDKTGDRTLFRDIRKDRSTLNLLQALRKEVQGLGDDGDKAGGSFLSGFREGIGSLPSELKGALILGAGTAAVAAAPLIGAAIGGAVLGGVGVGGIIGGIALAARDPRVQAEGAKLGQNLLGSLGQAAEPVTNQLLSVFSDLEGIGQDFAGQLGAGFTKLAPSITALVNGLDRLVFELGPGLSDAFEAAVPVIQAIANELPDIGAAISDTLSDISSQSDNAAAGIIGLADALEFSIQAAGNFVGALAWVYGGLVKVGDKANDLGDEGGPLGWLLGATGGPATGGWLLDWLADVAAKTEGAKETSYGLAGGFKNVAGSAEEAKDAVADLKNAFDHLFDITIGLDQATLNYEKGIDKFNKVMKENSNTLDINTEAGQNNQQAIIDRITDIDDLRTAEINSGASIEDANKKYDQRLERLKKEAIAAGLSKEAVDALIRKYKEIPKKAETEIKISGLSAATQRLIAYIALLGEAEGIKANAFSDYRYYERNPSGKRASGGPVGSGKTYLVGEQGPELVTFGADGYVHDAASTQAMMSGSSGGSSGGWSGGGWSGGPQNIDLNISLDLGDGLVKTIRKQVQVLGGRGPNNVQAAFGS